MTVPPPHTVLPAAPHAREEYHDDIVYPSARPFLLVHLACLAAFWTGVPRTALVTCLVLYLVRMFGVTAGYHRYFSHRSFKTGRVFQFLLAFLAQSTAQRGALWWAATHRHHHRHSDTEDDVHSPRHRYLPAAVLAVGCLAFGGWAGLVVGFFWSTTLLARYGGHDRASFGPRSTQYVWITGAA
jgi:stearoyl-CoA desaturase (delta-9 desaturase)